MRLIIEYSSANQPVEWIEFSYNSWDDYGYKTTLKAEYCNSAKVHKVLGSVQIAFAGMESGKIEDKLKAVNDALPEGFFSLGTSEDYYVNVCSLGNETAQRIYQKLNDLAYDLNLFDKYKRERVVVNSLLRGRSEFMVREQLNRIAHGGAKLTEYNFKYISSESNGYSQFCLDFNIKPDSNPPTNIHVVIGRNGTGKTYLLKNMINALMSKKHIFGKFENTEELPFDVMEEGFFEFANILCVSFSPFDDYSLITSEQDSAIPYSYIGLKKEKPDLLSNILDDFISYFRDCMATREKMDRWRKSLDLLKSDPTFAESGVFSFLEKWKSGNESIKANCEEYIRKNFKSLSSGHKVVLLIVTACISKLEEKSIIFLDEPENHLHPPLLSAFTRTISYLLINRNSVAIVSTHSPVILQEVPKSCVWRLFRSGKEISANRLGVETFGATIGTLTREVFGLEVQQSGFNKMLSQNIEDGHSYEDIINMYDGQIGEEAMSILHTMLMLKEKEYV